MTFGGGGPRACVGKRKALAEAAMVLVMMAKRFRGIESRDNRDWAGVAIKAAANKHGCKVGLVV
jgi:cytochrome P450 monooxygenase